MGKNYDFRLNPKSPAREEIERHRDFDALLEQYRRRRKPRPPRRRSVLLYLASAAAAALLALLIYLGTGPRSGTDDAYPSAESYFASRPLLEQPLPQIEKTYRNRQIANASGGAVDLGPGSRLIVPEKAFMDDRGNPIQGNINLQYRQMRDYVDFFLSGVPMQYDSAGNRYQMESAGMIELFALHRGKQVQLAPDKSIRVEMVSEITLPSLNLNVSPRYQVHQLDTAARRWVFRDVADMQLLDDQLLDPKAPLYAAKKSLLDELAKIEQRYEKRTQTLRDSLLQMEKPVAPQRAGRNDLTLELDINSDKVELTGERKPLYEGAIWRVTNQPDTFDEQLLRLDWRRFRIRPLDDQNYRLTLEREDRQLQLTIQPVLVGEAYEKARQSYRREMTAYNRRLQQRRAALQELTTQLEDSLEEARNALNLKYRNTVEEKIEEEKLPASAALIRRKVLSRFSVNQLGLWNCNRLLDFKTQPVTAQFVDQNDQPYEPGMGYVVKAEKNTVYRFYSAGEHIQLPADLSSGDLLWMVSEKGEIAVLRSKEQLPDDNLRPSPEEELRLTLVERRPENEAEVRELLRL